MVKDLFLDRCGAGNLELQLLGDIPCESEVDAADGRRGSPEMQVVDDRKVIVKDVERHPRWR